MEPHSNLTNATSTYPQSIPENVSPETVQVVEPPRRSEQHAHVPTLNTSPPPESERPVTLSAEQVLTGLEPCL